ELVGMKEEVARLNVDETKEKAEDMKERIDSFYEILEKEVKAKHFVDYYKAETGRHLELINRDARDMHDECLFVQQSYKISESDAAIPKACLEKLEELNRRF